MRWSNVIDTLIYALALPLSSPHSPHRPGANYSVMVHALFLEILPLQVWWGSLVAIGLLNSCLYLRMRCKAVWVDDRDTRSYQIKMFNLAGPFVFACFWRGAFPNIYAPRITFFDTILCSILIGRRYFYCCYIPARYIYPHHTTQCRLYISISQIVTYYCV
jgi:hypothetical protein